MCRVLCHPPILSQQTSCVLEKHLFTNLITNNNTKTGIGKQNAFCYMTAGGRALTNNSTRKLTMPLSSMGKENLSWY